MAPRTSASGFSLIELLVVVAIIVVLLALLTPALDQAMYQADLAACAAQQKAVGTAAVNYALNQRRAYPHKPAIYNDMSNWQAITLAAPPGPWTAYDDRPTLAGYFQLNRMLNDPLAAAVDLEQTHPLSHVFANVSMWFGFKYWGEKGMLRMGDRLEYTFFPNDPQRRRIERFDILVSDRDGVRGADSQSTHPDSDEVLANYVRQDADHPWLGGNQGIGLVSGEAVKITFSLWLTFVPGARRGTVDTNYTFQDLSVRRYSGVRWDEKSRSDRMVGIRSFVNKGDIEQHMPRY
jgi:prepilin-type N-terminal cleavage/methylation domain-containing protein